MSLALTLFEATELERCEALIQRGYETFIEVGTALLKIRDDRLYRVNFSSFEDYCRERWGMSRVHAHRMIEAARVAESVLPIGNNIPSTESQARPLARLEPEQQREAWQLAVESSPNGQPTAKQVEAAAEQVSPRSAPAPKLSPDQRDLFDDRPAKAGPAKVVNSASSPSASPRPTVPDPAPPSPPPLDDDDGGPVYVRGNGPAFPPKPGQKRDAAGWEKMIGALHGVHQFVREQGGIEGSVHGWTAAERKRLAHQLEFALKELNADLDAWIPWLRRDS